MRRDMADEPSTVGRADFVASLAAGLRVLNVFSPDQPELGVGELSRVLNMDKRRTQRLVSTLYELGYLEQDETTRRYRPGLAVLDLGYAALQSLDVRQVAQPYLRELLTKFGQNVTLVMRNDLDVILVESLRGERYRIGVQLYVGDSYPLHVSSAGKAILAQLPENELTELLDRIDFGHGMTSHSVTSRERLEGQLRQARERGYAVQDQETAVGVRSASAALTHRDGHVVAAIVVAMPTQLVTMTQMEADVAPEVVAAARRISERLPLHVDYCPVQRRRLAEPARDEQGEHRAI